MAKKTMWKNKTSLGEKYSLMKILGKTPLEVADPIAYSNYFPKDFSNDKNPEQN